MSAAPPPASDVTRELVECSHCNETIQVRAYEKHYWDNIDPLTGRWPKAGLDDAVPPTPDAIKRKLQSDRLQRHEQKQSKRRITSTKTDPLFDFAAEDTAELVEDAEDIELVRAQQASAEPDEAADALRRLASLPLLRAPPPPPIPPAVPAAVAAVAAAVGPPDPPLPSHTPVHSFEEKGVRLAVMLATTVQAHGGSAALHAALVKCINAVYPDLIPSGLRTAASVERLVTSKLGDERILFGVCPVISCQTLNAMADGQPVLRCRKCEHQSAKPFCIWEYRSLIRRLKNLFQRSDFMEQLNATNRRPPSSAVLKDVMDGEGWQRWKQFKPSGELSGFLEHSTNLLLQLFYDGYQTSSGSVRSSALLCATILNLPVDQRSVSLLSLSPLSARALSAPSLRARAFPDLSRVLRSCALHCIKGSNAKMS
jgi:hypothetical protein